MRVIYFLLIGLGIYLISTLVLGLSLRIIRPKKAAGNITRIMHLILIFSVSLPLVYAIFNRSSNIFNFDKLLNIPSLPFPGISKTIGMMMILMGISLMTFAVIFLLRFGEGLPLLSLTKNFINDLLSRRMRNPMMLGLYFTVVGVGLWACSTFFTLWSLIGLVPVNIFYLKFFEERELEMKFGQTYREYKQRVPFLFPGFRKTNYSG